MPISVQVAKAAVVIKTSFFLLKDVRIYWRIRTLNEYSNITKGED